MVVLQANTDDRFSPKPSKLEAFVSSAVLRASRAACLFERGFIILGVNKQVELNAALERARSEKKIEQDVGNKTTSNKNVSDLFFTSG